jgi:hypothetical protein
MKSFKRHVAESFNTKLNWKHSSSKSGSDIIHIFTSSLDGSEIKLTIEDDPGVVAEIYFERDGRMDATKQGSASKVFGAVLNKVIDWLNEQPTKPRQIYFVAQDQYKDSREGLYDRMIARYADKLGYTSRKFKVTQQGHSSYYLDIKKGN